MTEEEEFEFRLRLEQEQKSKPTAIPESQVPIFQKAHESGILKGFLDPAAGGAQLINKLSGLTSLDEQMPDLDKQIRREEQAYQQRRKAEGEEGVDWARIGGNIVSIPSLVTMGAGAPTTLAARGAQGMGIGAKMAALQPVQNEDFWQTKALQTGTGAVTGGTLPYLTRGLSKGGETVIDILAKRRLPKQAEKFLREQAGEQSKDIVRSLQQAKPGQTSAQAIAAGGREAGDVFGGPLVKLESELAREPGIGDPLRSIYEKQAVGRQKIIDAIAGTDKDMANAIAKRTSITRPLYDIVRESKNTVDINPVVSTIDDFIAKNPKQTDIVEPLLRIKKDLDTTSPGALYSLSKQIKTMMGQTTEGGQKAYNVGKLAEVKRVLDDQIGKSENAFKAAQSAYKELSSPINRMEVGRYLQEALTTAMERESPARFTGALRAAPQTLKRATGFPRYNELGQVLKPEEVSNVQKVADELLTRGRTKQMAGEISSVVGEVPERVTQEGLNVLWRPATLVNQVLSRLGKKATPEMKRILTDVMQNPQQLERILALPPQNPTRKMVEDFVNQLTIMSGAQTSARTAGQ